MPNRQRPNQTQTETYRDTVHVHATDPGPLRLSALRRRGGEPPPLQSHTYLQEIYASILCANRDSVRNCNNYTKKPLKLSTHFEVDASVYQHLCTMCTEHPPYLHCCCTDCLKTCCCPFLSRLYPHTSNQVVGHSRTHFPPEI